MNKARETIRSLLQAPQFPEDQKKSRQAKNLYALTLNLLIVSMLILLVGMPFVFVEKLITGSVIVALMLVSILVLYIARRGQIKTASILMASGLWVMATTLTWISGGIHSLNIVFFASNAALAGLLLGSLPSILHTVLSLLTLLIMALLEMAGYQFPQLFAFPSLAVWFVMLVTLVTISLSNQITRKNLTGAFLRFENELDERRQAEAHASRLAEERLLLYNFGIAIAGGKNLYDTLSQIQAQLARLLPNTLFFIGLYDKENDFVTYPFFFVQGKNLPVSDRKLSDQPGMTGAVIYNRETLYVSDILTPAIEAAYKPVRAPYIETHTFLGVPLIVNDQVIGVMSIQHTEIDAFRQEQIRLFEVLAVQVGIVIERAKIIEQLQQELTERERAEAEVRQERDKMAERRRLLEKVIEMGKETARITDLIECLRKAHQYIREELGFDRVGLFLYDSEKCVVQGAFGTDRQGNLVYTDHYARNINHFAELKRLLHVPGGMIYQPNYQATYNPPPGDDMYGVVQHLSVSAWAGENPVALIAVDNLITQRPLSEEAIEALRLYAGYVGLAIHNSRLNTQLEQRVRERTIQLELAMDELESFSYSVGHDLRAPLRGMRGFSQIIMDENGDQLSQAAKTNLEHIIRASQNMGELIDALLDFSRLTRVPLQRHNTNLSHIAETILNYLAEGEPNRPTRIEVQPDLTANVDRKTFELALKHLLENAWKFTSKTDYPEIIFGETEINQKRAFYVRDNGAGFNMAHSKKLFGAFQRLHRVDEFPGHGAGLAIVQRIIRRHGGEIWGEGAPNQGAIFYFTVG